MAGPLDSLLAQVAITAFWQSTITAMKHLGTLVLGKREDLTAE